MPLAYQIFPLVSASGPSTLGHAQQNLLGDKARWLHKCAVKGLNVAPTIVVTRSAWEHARNHMHLDQEAQLQHLGNSLLSLVPPDGERPMLAVRCAPVNRTTGLLQASLNIPPPKDLNRLGAQNNKLHRALDAAFQSYDTARTEFGDKRPSEWDSQVVLIQAMARKPLRTIDTRSSDSGALAPDIPVDSELVALCDQVDRIVGAHVRLDILEQDGKALQLFSVRPMIASTTATLHAAVDRVDKGYWEPARALQSLDAEGLVPLLHPRLAPAISRPSLASGLGVSPGAACGAIVFSTEDAIRWVARGKSVILVAVDTGPGDVEGMKAAAGMLTSRGGGSSHAAVIARITGKPCVTGLRGMNIDIESKSVSLGSENFQEGDSITIDGTDGQVFGGRHKLIQPDISGDLSTALQWADNIRALKIRTNVETVEDAKAAIAFGAEGIGLARTEHMFFGAERMLALQRMILSEGESDRRSALEILIEYQTTDYVELFAAMSGFPVTVRLFDPPLHEFLPRSEEEIVETAKALGMSNKALEIRLERLSEVNPMLGHRGCRLAISYPEILDMQVSALLNGALLAAQQTGSLVKLEIMIPFVSATREVGLLKERTMVHVSAREAELRDNVDVSIGAMIELPRAAIRAADLSGLVDFFSFGTNDLTQTVFGISRDDAPAFLSSYIRAGIYDEDPFITIDEKGVGELIRQAIIDGRANNKGITMGICGEHAGDPASIAFFCNLGVDYISCSPYRVPIARLAAAQAEVGMDLHS